MADHAGGECDVSVGDARPGRPPAPEQGARATQHRSRPRRCSPRIPRRRLGWPADDDGRRRSLRRRAGRPLGFPQRALRHRRVLPHGEMRPLAERRATHQRAVLRLAATGSPTKRSMWGGAMSVDAGTRTRTWGLRMAAGGDPEAATARGASGSYDIGRVGYAVQTRRSPPTFAEPSSYTVAPARPRLLFVMGELTGGEVDGTQPPISVDVHVESPSRA
jgi:hypothetical protein